MPPDDQRTPSRALDVALVSTCALSTPPAAYGGTELVLADLSRELVRLGHRVTVFATGDSTCEATRTRSLFERPVWPPDELAELRHASFAWHEIAQGSFDVVHVNHAQALPFTELVQVPTVATVHHDRDERLDAHYASFPSVAFTAISGRHRELLHGVPFRKVIHHGLAVERFPAGEGDGGYCAFVGRFAPEKAPHLAIDAARAAGVPLVIGGAAHPCAQAYFERDVAPRLGAGTSWIGEVDQQQKVALLRRARCLLFPIQWEEPFGLVMIEAMLVGTPVIAFGRGSVPEVVEDGLTGFVVRSVDEMAERIRGIGELDRRACRARALSRWGAARMAREYVELYRETIDTARGLHSLRSDRRRRHHGSETLGRAG
jgi:glycosyltransferase involved in cell wall biosynthesis